jgi:hypothetical protein
MIDPNRAFSAVLAAPFAAAVSLAADTDGGEGKKGRKRGSSTSTRCTRASEQRIMAGLAEFERDLIRERIKSGISAAKSDKRRSRRSGRTPKAGHPGRNGRKPVKPFSPDPLSWFREERECMRNNIPHEDG